MPRASSNYQEKVMAERHSFENRAVSALRVAALGLVALLASAAATAQVRPALVRSVDEPARVPYAYDLAPVCAFVNSCEADFPAVPAGKRLRITSVRLMFSGTNVTSFFAVRRADTTFPTVAFPVAPFSGAYFGTLISGSFDVDLIYEAGQQPALELGNTSSINNNIVNRFGVTGYLVDVAP
jgi:hypothetical protein